MSDDQVLSEEVKEEEIPAEEPNEGQSSENPDEVEGTPQKVEVNGREYTVEELQEIAQKAQGYDALLPDYTKKAQRLSELEDDKKQEEQKAPEEEKAPYEIEGWEPKDYKELGQAIKAAEEKGMKRAVEFLENQKRAEMEARGAVDTFVADVKKTNKDFDQQDFADYAIRHSFPLNTPNDLKAVYSSYAELKKAGVLGAERALKNKAGRQEKVNSAPGGQGEGKLERGSISGTGMLERALGALDRLQIK